MRVKSTKNPSVIVTWDIRESGWPMKSIASCRSKIQYLIGQVIIKKYPLDPILEDVTLPESRLSLDFFLPHRKLAVEVQGAQHDQMNPYFHHSNEDFVKQQGRDDEKRFFCELNNIKLYTVRTEEEAKRIFNV